MKKKNDVSRRPRVLVADIETVPIEGIFWRLGEQRITHDQVQKDWSILSYCAKWIGSDKLIYEDTMGRGAARVRDDSRLLKSLHRLLDEADIVVAQNGIRFDIRMIRARLIENGYKPFSPVRVIDTYRAADKLAGFTSHKLAWLSEKLAKTKKSEHRQFPGLELWKECLKDNPKARAEMKKYNPTDVIATEEVYMVLRPWIEGHPNLAVYSPSALPACVVCGSHNLHPRGTQENQSGSYERLLCHDCGKWNRGKTNLLSKESRKALLVN